MPAVRSVLSLARLAPDKRAFAKGARGFAKRARALAKLPGFPTIWIASAAAGALMTLTGGFGTGAMPLAQRALFWAVLMGWSALKWQLWFAFMVRAPRDWTRAAIMGGVLLSLPIPFEVLLSGRAAGIDTGMPNLLGTWGRGLAIGTLVFCTILLVTRTLGYRPSWRLPVPEASGLLQRARVDPASLTAIEAEDHYCRVHRRDGASALIHYRFGDALEEVAALEGMQVHRGAWVAANAIEGTARDGRRWELLLAGGRRVPVSATYLPQARARGWIDGRGKPGL
jgi:hypothetical protein